MKAGKAKKGDGEERAKKGDGEERGEERGRS